MITGWINKQWGVVVVVVTVAAAAL